MKTKQRLFDEEIERLYKLQPRILRVGEEVIVLMKQTLDTQERLRKSRETFIQLDSEINAILERILLMIKQGDVEPSPDVMQGIAKWKERKRLFLPKDIYK